MITTSPTKLMLTAGAVLLLAIGLFFPLDAFATSPTNVTEQTKQLAGQLGNIPRLIAMASYVIGTFFAVRALFALKGFIEAPDDNPITKVLGFAAVAVLLILLPYIISIVTGSIGAKVSDVSSSAGSFKSSGTENMD